MIIKIFINIITRRTGRWASQGNNFDWPFYFVSIDVREDANIINLINCYICQYMKNLDIVV